MDRRPRFPYGPALLCAACLAMAGWLWMRYSYCWEVCVEDLVIREASPDSAPFPPFHEFPNRNMIGRYVLLRGHFFGVEDEHPSMLMCRRQLEAVLEQDSCGVWVFLGGKPPYRHRATDAGAYKGRVCETVGNIGLWWEIEDFDEPYVTGVWGDGVAVRVTASRFHPASVAGLVVAAFGTFVFSLYLRQWLRERAAADRDAGQAAVGSLAPSGGEG